MLCKAVLPLLTLAPSYICPRRSHPTLAPRWLVTLPEQPLGTAKAGWKGTSHPPSRCGLGAGGEHPWSGEHSLRCRLYLWDAPQPISVWGFSAQDAKLWVVTWSGDWKGHPTKAVLPCEPQGDAQLCSCLPLAAQHPKSASS